MSSNDEIRKAVDDLIDRLRREAPQFPKWHVLPPLSAGAVEKLWESGFLKDCKGMTFMLGPAAAKKLEELMREEEGGGEPWQRLEPPVVEGKGGAGR